MPKKDYTKPLKNDIKGIRIGVPKEFFGEGINEEVKETLEKAIQEYKNMGAEIEEFSLDIAQYALATYYILACAELENDKMEIDYNIRYSNFINSIIKEKYPEKYKKRLKELKEEEE